MVLGTVKAIIKLFRFLKLPTLARKQDNDPVFMTEDIGSSPVSSHSLSQATLQQLQFARWAKNMQHAHGIVSK